MKYVIPQQNQNKLCKKTDLQLEIELCIEKGVQHSEGNNF